MIEMVVWTQKEAYVDFAEECYELGYRAFKVHGWNDGNVKEEVENILNLSKNVGHKMTLMLRSCL